MIAIWYVEEHGDDRIVQAETAECRQPRNSRLLLGAAFADILSDEFLLRGEPMRSGTQSGKRSIKVELESWIQR